MSNALPINIVAINGDDATTFLQGQLTQDIGQLENTWQYSAQCNPKGRAIALFQVFAVDNTYYLLLDINHTETIINNLKKYVMRSKVTFNETTLQAYFFNTQSEGDENSVISENETHTLSLTDGYIVLSKEELTNASEPKEWTSSNISHSIPKLYETTLGTHTPEELSLDILGAVSFTKGCYTGQEVVARMHYLGKAKKRLFIAHTELNITLDMMGEKVYNPEGKALGSLVDTDNSGSILISANTEYCNKHTLNLVMKDNTLTLMSS